MLRYTKPWALIALATPLLSSPLQAASFKYTTLAVPEQRITLAAGTINAINDSDQVVGSVEDNDFHFQGFVWSSGEFTLYPVATVLGVINNEGLAAGYTQIGSGYVTIDTGNGKTHTYNNHFDKNPFVSRLYGIDASGAVVAQDQYAKNVTAGYIFAGPTKTLLLAPGSDVKYGGTFATAINDAATVTGSYFSGGVYEHGFSYQNGAFTTFDVPNALGGTFPYFIGDDGSIAGGYAPTPGALQVGFVFCGGQFTSISPPGANSSYVNAIGPYHEFVGSYWDDTGGHGFIFRAGRYYTIDVPGGKYTTIHAVNALGTLVGTYQDINGSVLSYVAQCAVGRNCTH